MILKFNFFFKQFIHIKKNYSVSHFCNKEILLSVTYFKMFYVIIKSDIETSLVYTINHNPNIRFNKMKLLFKTSHLLQYNLCHVR